MATVSQALLVFVTVNKVAKSLSELRTRDAQSMNV